MDRISAMETRDQAQRQFEYTNKKAIQKYLTTAFKYVILQFHWGGIKGRDRHHTQLLEQNLLTFIITTLVANKGFSNNFVQCYVQTHKTQTGGLIFAKFI